ncbi:paralemmin-1 isoform X7 [Seriola lalandi dorsalis]|uniref:paralemmin-1 isoform X7 n=1 Tax=Seriola lalandi dorsalis TaxID=1841481 RepID=UPI000C6F4512|nr:paralemmin-1 isoform X7 [Seriola lalandi dorsalis]
MNRAVLDLDSDMEVSQALCQEDRLQLIAEKRKWQTEIENKKRQLEDDRRALQHLKSKALRERWLLDGQEQDEVKRQLEQDEAKTRSLEDTINRLEQELVSLETGSVCQTITHTTVSSGSDKAMYSVEIKVERDRLTGETRVLSTNTTLPVDLSHQGVKVYEDEQKVVHEMNGEDGIHLLSSSEVEELIHKADEASMMSQTVATVTSLPTVEVQEEAMPESPPSKPARVAGEITGLEAKPGGEPSVAKASAENPVTMVFMGYQSVEDEAETKKVLGLQGTVTAELVLIDDANGKTSPEGGGKEEASSTAQTAALPPPASPDPPPTTKPPVAIPASNGETAGEVAGEVERGAVEVKKEKQLCKCCSIM